MSKEDICFMSACDMAEKIKNQELTSVEITEIIIERIEKINPLINAYCTPTLDLARDMAKKADDAVKKGEKLGLLHGIPTSIQDLMDTKGIRTTYGCVIYENYVPDKNVIAVDRLLNEGIVMLGKTNTPSNGHKGVTDNLIFGESKNPWNHERTPGGSSGGSAAAVAAGLGPLTLGSDGGGSIRIPSCFCGVYGLKPYYSRIPRIYQKMGLSTMSHYGPIVRYVKDAALMMDAMAGPHPMDKFSLISNKINYLNALKDKPSKLKIGYSLDLGYIRAIDPDVEKAVMDSVQKFESLDWEVEHVKFSRMRKIYFTYLAIAGAGISYDFKDLIEEWRYKLTPTLVKMIDAGANISGFDIQQAEFARRKLDEKFDLYFKEYDILITPTTAVPAFELGKMNPTKIAGRTVTPLGWTPYTYIFNLTWHPVASIPCGWSSEGLPIGMQIVGKRYDEKTVLQVSQAFEEIAPWQDKKPQFNYK